jgi:hypothetical protein
MDRKPFPVRFPLFTPTSASWLNAVESFFAKLTKKRFKRGVFRSLQELKDGHQCKPKALYLTKDPKSEGHQMLDSIR